MADYHNPFCPHSALLSRICEHKKMSATIGPMGLPEIGAFARPEEIRFTEALPKTRSGKIMRRLLRELATSSDVKGDITTLEDFSVISKLKEQDEA